MAHDTLNDAMSNADYARAYIERGWKPIPLKPNDKAPESSGWQRQDVPDDRIDDVFTEGKNIGLILGPASGNIIDVDLDDPSTVKLANHFLPETGAVFSRESKPNSHWEYQVPDGDTLRRIIFQDPDGTLLLELRGEGHQTMVPPSMHPHGERLTWSIFDQPGQTTVEHLERDAGWLAGAAMMGRHWQEWDHRKHFITLHLSGGLLRAGVPLDVVKNFVKAVCLIGGEGDWPDREKAVDSTFEKLQDPDAEVTGWPKLSELIGNQYVTKLVQWLRLPTQADRPTRTDTGNAERLVARHGDDLKFNESLGGWFVWDGTRFRRDETGAIVERMKDTARSILDEANDATARAAKIEDNEKREKAQADAEALTKWGFKTLNERELSRAIKLARSDERVTIHPDAFDTDPYLLNVRNGTVDLMRGALMPHERRDRLTKFIDLPYDPEATCPRWLEYLNTIHGGDVAMIDAIQRAVGYSLTGYTSEQLFFLMWGPPGTGKSTFIETLRRIFGDYAVNAESETFAITPKSGRATPEITRFRGARLVTASESEKTLQLASARLKHLTGGDRVTASDLYTAPMEFTPVLKLWFSTNHKPRIPADEGGVWDRMFLLPFEVDMRNSPDRVRNMDEVFIPELAGILNWAIQGAVKWKHDGLTRPERSIAEQKKYRTESDGLTEFLDEMTATGPDFKTRTGDFQRAYNGWAKENGHEELNTRELRSKMEKHFEYQKTKTGRYWIGVNLIEVVDDPEKSDRSQARTPFGRPAAAS